MRRHHHGKARLICVIAAVFLVVAGVALWRQRLSRSGGPRPAVERPNQGAGSAATDDSSLPAQADVGQALAAFNRGAAYLGQYKYRQGAAEFERALQRFPNWTAARLNLALAHLNMQEAHGAGKYLELAKQEFEQVLQQDPTNLHAWFALGTYYQHLGENARAAECFQKVHQADPEDLHAAYKYAETLIALRKNAEATRLLEQVVRRDAGFVSAVYRLAMEYQKARQPDRARPLFARFKQLSAVEVSGGSFTVDKTYGAAGKYYQALGADHLPLPSDPPAQQPALRVVFSPEVGTIQAPVRAWQWRSNAIRLPGIAIGDVDRDGQLDVCLAGHGPDGATTIVRNTGSGQFAPPERIADHGVVPCFGDIDNDGDLDLWLGRAGTDLLLTNDGKGHFEESAASEVAGPSLLTSTARVLDLDSDGDLDLLAMRLGDGTVPAARGMQAAAGSLLQNNRDGTLTDIAAQLGLAQSDIAIATVVYDDFDNDRDLDLILFPADRSPLVWINERVGKYRLVPSDRTATATTAASSASEVDAREPRQPAAAEGDLPVSTTGLDIGGVCGATTGDPNKDGLRDLLLFSGDQVRLLHNRGRFHFAADDSFADRHGRLGGTGGQFVDIDNDGDLDIVVADAHRHDGSRGPVLLLNDWPNRRFLNAARLDPGLLLGALQTHGPAACVAADFTGNGLCDILLVATGSPPRLVKNVTQGGHWIALDLEGTRPRDRMARSDRSAIGARVEVKAGTVFQQHVVGTPAGPTAMAPLRLHAGLGPHPQVEWLRILWPDAVLQAELELAADRTVAIAEVPRKTSSCPHLFAWNGSRYEFVSDFGGMGGLGYLIAPGHYAPPDPTEYVPLPQLSPQRDRYVLQVVEPLEEAIYFDEAKLIAVDHRRGTTVYPREMLACETPPPFEMFCYDASIQPVRATNHQGDDVTDRLRDVDRRVAGATDLDDRFVGYAADHFVQLDFGDRLARLPAAARTILYLQGWVEYAYSTTNFAAGQAGLQLKAPTIQVERDGRWHDLLREIGYPAGLQHMMTIDLTGHLRPTDRKLRITSNMELFWDQIFLAVHREDAIERVQEVAAAVADLHFRGYPREFSPDGRHPNLYDYANIDTAQTWKLMAGSYTRFGDVRQLLNAADDCYVIMGRGEEVTLEFPAAAFDPVPSGCVRSFLLKTDSYCKDMDLYTAFPDTVEPLPFHAMTGYPYGSDEHYPNNATTRDYRRLYNTRHIQEKRNRHDRTTEYVGPGRDLAAPAGVERVTIGYFGPHQPGTHDADLWLAAQLAVADVNAAAGCRGLPLQLVPAWSNNPWGSGVSQVTRMIYQGGVWALIGGPDGPSTHLAEQVVAKARLVLLSPGSTDTSAHQANVPWMFSCLPGDHRLAEPLTKHLAAVVRSRPFAVASADDHDSRQLVVHLTRGLAARQMAPRFEYVFNAQKVDMGRLATQLIRSEPAAIVIVAKPQATAELVRALRELDYRHLILGGPAMGRRQFIELAGDATGDIAFPLLWRPSPRGTAFANRFRAQHKITPDYAAAASYDAVRLMATAIGKAGLNRARIGDVIRELAPYQGIAGPIRWDRRGGNNRDVPLGTIRKGRVVPWAEAE